MRCCQRGRGRSGGARPLRPLLPLPGRFGAGFSLRPDELSGYLAEIRALRAKAHGGSSPARSSTGFEQGRSVYEPYAENLPLDYRIGSVHFVAERVRHRRDLLVHPRPAKRGRRLRRLLELVRGIGERAALRPRRAPRPSKKFGFNPLSDMRALENEALDAIRAAAGPTS
jgi:hypothetical protein